jgi:predicted flap endonuclease-1-like 5' DNA nuclease
MGDGIMQSIEKIHGIDPVVAARLRNAGITTVNSLLKAASTRSGRREIAKRAGVQDSMLLRFVNHADLMRINGVGWQIACLLENAGVDSVPELAHRNPVNLRRQLAEANTVMKVVRQIPSPWRVAEWIEAARTMTVVVTH